MVAVPRERESGMAGASVMGVSSAFVLTAATGVDTRRSGVRAAGSFGSFLLCERFSDAAVVGGAAGAERTAGTT